MTAPDPSKLSDAELSALVAEKVAGWTNIWPAGAIDRFSRTKYFTETGLSPLDGRRTQITPYSTSADAVLPLLENKVEWSCYATKGRFEIHITIRDIANITTCDVAPTFPRAACLALLAAANREGKV